MSCQLCLWRYKNPLHFIALDLMRDVLTNPERQLLGYSLLYARSEPYISSK
jgi:hypothetical protein